MHGVQLAARKAKGKTKPAVAQRGSLLFSHRGVTGPAVLDLSHHAVMALERDTPPPGRVAHLDMKSTTLQGFSAVECGVVPIAPRDHIAGRLSCGLGFRV